MSALSHRRAVVALVATGALLLAAFAVASQAEASTLYACVKKSGTARVFTKKPKCKKGESKISWNAEGPAGKNGANGASGTNGTNGTSGTNGTNGAVAGYVVVQSGEVSFTQLESKESNALVMSKSLPAGSYIVNGNVEVIAAQVGTNEEGGGPPHHLRADELHSEGHADQWKLSELYQLVVRCHQQPDHIFCGRSWLGALGLGSHHNNLECADGHVHERPQRW
jgi:hypothetical protein